MGEKALALILLTSLSCAGLWAAEATAGVTAEEYWRGRQEAALTQIAADANDGVAWTDLAEAALMRGDSATAGSALEQVATLRPADPRGWFLSGCLALNLRRHDEARVAFARAVELDPAFVEARFFLGRACRYLGRLEEALAHFAAVLTARPTYVAARTYRIRVLQELDRRQERDVEIAALYALRRAGGVAALQAASAYRRDRLVLPSGAAVVLECFDGEPVRWRAIAGKDDTRREVVVCRDGNGWMLAAVTPYGGVRVAAYEALPNYDAVRTRLVGLFTAAWPPAGERVTLELRREADLDHNQ